MTATPGEILELVNAERAKSGCPALKENAQLAKAAQPFAEDASKNNLDDHTGSDGSSPEQRIAAAGYVDSGVCISGTYVVQVFGPPA
ncbi:CAP domain-containing protein [Streptomyces sp. NPDC048603]|uniref:CAP domain-containing protein n=1 Tax=Streptomyces sp. NPDC048603 TaxID=3365577 RepID=UPI0037130FFF